MTDQNDFVYLDYAATAPVRDEVWQATLPYLNSKFGNPSSLYAPASEVRDAVEQAREQVAKILNTRPSNITFTSGGTESNNTAIKGVAFANQERGKHIIISALEHPSVRQPAEQLATWGWEMSVIGVDKNGALNLDELQNALRADTVLVSVMYVNNELGTIQDIGTISQCVKQKADELNTKIVFHTDATQAAGKLPLDTKQLGVDMLTLSGHKLGAFKGTGALHIERSIIYEPLIVGGGQERLRRAGTENVAGIVGFGAALTLADAEREQSNAHSLQLKNRLLAGLKRIHPAIMVNSSGEMVPHIVNVSFPNITGETLLISLDFENICVSSGSACSSASLEPSAVLRAIGLSDSDAISSIRFSFGKDTTEREIELVIEKLAKILKKLEQLQ